MAARGAKDHDRDYVRYLAAQQQSKGDGPCRNSRTGYGSCRSRSGSRRASPPGIGLGSWFAAAGQRPGRSSAGAVLAGRSSAERPTRPDIPLRAYHPENHCRPLGSLRGGGSPPNDRPLVIQGQRCRECRLVAGVTRASRGRAPPRRGQRRSPRRSPARFPTCRRPARRPPATGAVLPGRPPRRPGRATSRQSPCRPRR